MQHTTIVLDHISHGARELPELGDDHPNKLIVATDLLYAIANLKPHVHPLAETFLISRRPVLSIDPHVPESAYKAAYCNASAM